MAQPNISDPVLHVIVVGFHHKKGCQVEYSYPPLIEGNSVESHEVPEEWKHISSLALPDGAHNYVKDTVYFLLPGRKGSLQTVYGVSCYRQMDAKDLINRTADVTRSTVQKSVCVLSHLPLFGLIKAKLELITHAYFDEKDFSQVTLLEQTYNNLNSSLNQSLLEGSQVFLGLSIRSLVALYKHKIIILFKLLLLERRVLMFGSPVESLCETVLGIISLFPGMLENGLGQACNQWNKKILSPTLSVAKINQDEAESDHFLEVRYHSASSNRGSSGSPLCEVLGHMHNSSLNLEAESEMNYVSSDSERKTGSVPVHNPSEAPESLSIPREPFFLQGTEGTYNNTDKCTLSQTKQASTCDPAISKSSTSGENSPKSDLSPTSPHKDFPPSGKSPLICRSISNDSDKLSVHVSHRGKRDCGDVLEGSDIKHESVESPEDSPLAHVNEITHIEAVQCGVSNLNVHFDVSDNRNAKSDLSLDNTVNLTGSFEAIEELDSPESIREIDSEDCFSWEQDRLQLTLHDDIRDEIPDLKDIASTDSAIDSEHSKSLLNTEHANIDHAERESVSSDSTSTSTSAHSQGDIKEKSGKSNKKGKALKSKLSAAFSKVGNKSKTKLSTDTSQLETPEGEVTLMQDKFGHPLAVFTNGSVCHPYLSLQYHDILTDVNIRCFFIGATNVLFKQRRQLIDVLVQTEDGKVDIRDKELQRQLSLSTADLRFAEYLVKIVTEDSQGLYMEGTEWEGSDEWLRAQFKHYVNSLLSTIVQEDTHLLEDFGTAFISAWKTTYNYRYWQSESHPEIKDIPPGHPFQGNLNMADVRVRFNHTMQNSERGRKINAAVVQTGKYVMQTGKAVGGALTSARSVVSTWFSSWRQPSKTPDQEEEQQQVNTDEGLSNYVKSDTDEENKQ